MKPDIRELEFKDVLSDLAVLYRQGVLVPFIGSGMSVPTCTTWVEFLRKLGEDAGVEIPNDLVEGNATVDPQTLYRFADRTVVAIRPLRETKRAHAYRNALQAWRNDDDREIPPQTKSLALLFWPLVLSTNYDDLYWCATDPSSRPSILGRRIDDCHRVLRSLDETTPPILWVLQGFLGGQGADPGTCIKDSNHQRELLNQLVVGHQQYQRAINSETHFRRAFAEIFRRRSLLFLGSGLLEDYLVNLFSEIIHHQGPGAYPHFAMVRSKERDRYSSSFLQTRLGVVPVFYENYADVPEHLNELSTLVRYWPGSTRATKTPPALTLQFDEIGVTLLLTASSLQPKLKVRISKSPLPLPTRSECSIISVGRWDNLPLLGTQADGYLKGLKKAQIIPDVDQQWLPLDDEPAYVYRYGTTCVFGVAARSKKLKGRKHDRRDLGVIPGAICEALTCIDREGFEVVHVGPIASGKQRPWHPIHPFAQTLRGIRKFITESTVSSIRFINLFIVDPAVWYPLIAGRIRLAELLTSALTTNRVELTDNEGNNDSFAVTLQESPTLEELLRHCKINREHWRVKFSPEPTDHENDQEPSNDEIVSPTMTVVLRPHDSSL